MALYRRTLAESGLESAAWGHIGNNHLHVNILPRDAQDYRRGGELFAQWGEGEPDDFQVYPDKEAAVC